ncbi:hypothetical protein V2G26_007356 [Clonostachys chloroleuca]
MALIIKNYSPKSGKFSSKNERIRVSQPTTRRQNGNDSNSLVICQLGNGARSNEPSPRENSDWKSSPELAAHTEDTAAQYRVVQPTPDKDPKTLPREETFRDNDPSNHPRITGQATISSTHHVLLPAATLSGVPSILEHCAGRPKTSKALPTSPILPTATTPSTLAPAQHNSNPTPPESQNSNVSSSTSTCKDNISEISVDSRTITTPSLIPEMPGMPSPPLHQLSELREDNITINSDKPDYSKGIEVEKYSGLSANPAPKELEQFDDPAVIVSKDIEWAVDENQGLLGARRLGEEWEFLTPFATTFEPDYKLLNCEELIKKFNADYGPSKRPGTTRAVEPRDPEKELIYPINKEGFVGREYVDGELRYGISWPSMWLPESALGEKLIDDFWREFLGIEGNIEVFKSNKRRQDYKVSTKKKRRRKHDDIDSLGDMRSL